MIKERKSTFAETYWPECDHPLIGKLVRHEPTGNMGEIEGVFWSTRGVLVHFNDHTCLAYQLEHCTIIVP